MKNRRIIRKRSFLLFEIVLSLFLISLCFFPLLKPHIGIRKIEMKNLKKMEWQHHAQNAFCNLKIRLAEHTVHRWNDLTQAKGVLDEIYKFGNKEYSCRYELKKIDGYSPANTTAKGLLLQAKMEFFNDKEAPFSFSRTLYVEKIAL